MIFDCVHVLMFLCDVFSMSSVCIVSIFLTKRLVSGASWDKVELSRF